jgi:hypothetical protein
MINNYLLLPKFGTCGLPELPFLDVEGILGEVFT